MTNFVNEAHRDIINKTSLLQSTVTITLTVNTSFYVMPSDFMEFYHVTFSTRTTNRILQETSIFQLDSLNNGQNWTNITGIPQSYYQDPSAPNSLWVYPVPSTTSQLGLVAANYFQKINVLVNSTDAPFQGLQRYQDYSDLLIYYPAGLVYAIEGEDNKSQNYFALYASRLDAMDKKAKNHPNFIPGMAGPSNSR